jgi:hypothetical protein
MFLKDLASLQSKSDGIVYNKTCNFSLSDAGVEKN